MRRWLTFMSTALVAALAVVAPATRAAADPLTLPDMGHPCSVTIDLEYNTTPITGTTITLFKVGDWETSGAYFELVSDFAASGVDITNITSADDNLGAAQVLFAYALANSIDGQAHVTDSNGKAVFDNLVPGLYLVSPGLARGYYPIAPYLVMLPEQGEGGIWVYDVNAEPKTAPMPASAPVSSTPPNRGNTGGAPVLTSTTVIGLGAVALALLALGITSAAASRRRQRATNHAA